MAITRSLPDTMSSSTSRSSPLTAVQLHVVVLIVSCLVGCAAGSCLSYGHSCWGAHGKRNGGARGGGDTQWFISRLAPVSSRAHQQSDPLQHQWLSKSPTDVSEDQRRVSLAEASMILPEDQDVSDDVVAADDKEVIIMEQPPRLYKILNRLPSKLEFKTPESK
ncbi:uncharacterized protein LOC124370054 [Homalodisca vitripennis]|uniref:uncharacterized protein LOC124370054 n=1 Tax=Homalodisca vitripennis TaxID=197043 RepID=UPI001EEC4E5B|nr:uncharacterized protein LOC124370054 [Homalodisca vitripennis]